MAHPAIIEQQRREREQARQGHRPALRIPAYQAPRPAPDCTVDFSVDFTI